MIDIDELRRTYRIPTFLESWAMALDFSGSMPWFDDRDPALVDLEAVAGDWRAVGNDLRAAMAEFEAEHGR